MTLAASTLASTPEIDALIAANAPIAIGVSGGKDSSALAVAVIILGENFDAGAKNLGERARVGGQIGTQGGGAHRFTSHVVVPSLLSLSWTPMASNSSRMRSDSAQFFAARAARRAVMRD